jgi:hypothetical protein
VRTCPQLVWHRQCWDVLQPLVSSDSAEELAQLRAGVFVAGFLKTPPPADLYDVLVDLEARRVSTSDDALQKCTSFLRDATAFFGGIQESEEQEALKSLMARTRTLVSKIQTLSGGAKLTAEMLTQIELPPHMDRLLLNIASAEGLA